MTTDTNGPHSIGYVEDAITQEQAYRYRAALEEILHKATTSDWTRYGEGRQLSWRREVVSAEIAQKALSGAPEARERAQS